VLLTARTCVGKAKEPGIGARIQSWSREYLQARRKDNKWGKNEMDTSKEVRKGKDIISK